MPLPSEGTQPSGKNSDDMSERPRLLVLDLLESYARERDIHVLLERHTERELWACVLEPERGPEPVTGVGRTAREAIMNALWQEGVEVPS
jgi:hypothetical protein